MLIVTGLPNVMSPATFAVVVKYANAMPSKIDIENAIQAGFLKALKFTQYRYSISELTHNIYIEIV